VGGRERRGFADDLVDALALEPPATAVAEEVGGAIDRPRATA
jgi:hypothetical protein